MSQRYTDYSPPPSRDKGNDRYDCHENEIPSVPFRNDRYDSYQDDDLNNYGPANHRGLLARVMQEEGVAPPRRSQQAPRPSSGGMNLRVLHRTSTNDVRDRQSDTRMISYKHWYLYDDPRRYEATEGEVVQIIRDSGSEGLQYPGVDPQRYGSIDEEVDRVIHGARQPYSSFDEDNPRRYGSTDKDADQLIYESRDEYARGRHGHPRQGNRGYGGRGYDDRGYDDERYDNRDYDGREYDHRGYFDLNDYRPRNADEIIARVRREELGLGDDCRPANADEILARVMREEADHREGSRQLPRPSNRAHDNSEYNDREFYDSRYDSRGLDRSSYDDFDNDIVYYRRSRGRESHHNDIRESWPASRDSKDRESLTLTRRPPQLLRGGGRDAR